MWIYLKNMYLKIYPNILIMKIISTTFSLLNLLNRSFNYVTKTSQLYKIDESHSLKHSIEVYRFAKNIYESELEKNPYLEKQQKVIYTSAIGHDMCDKKYMDEKEGIIIYQTYLTGYMNYEELNMVGKIISSMSYSKVKVNGYPNLGEYQLAYHIVREADLLAAYDIDRAIIYKMHKDNCDYDVALKDTLNLFNNRIFKMIEDDLFKTNYAKEESVKLHIKAIKDVETLSKIN